MNNEAVTLEARKAIDSYDAHNVREWAEKSRKEMAKAIHTYIGASELLSLFPYNPDMMLDDLFGCTYPKTDDTSYLTNQYLSTYEKIEQLEWSNCKRFKQKEDNR